MPLILLQPSAFVKALPAPRQLQSPSFFTSQRPNHGILSTFHHHTSVLHHRRHTTWHLTMSSSDFGLTEDGDFAIFGVNLEELSSPSEETTSTANGSVIGDNLSSLLSGARFSGLMDGNAAQSEMTFSTGTPIGSRSIGLPSLNDTIFGRIGGGSSASSFANQYDVRRDSTTNSINVEMDDESLNDNKEWLHSVIPTLSSSDLDLYARGLYRIGFHPECVTMCELKYEDLEFMKVLHRRYLFNEVTGVDHPFEC